MNERGVIMASRAEEVREDEYEDDFKEEVKKYSYL